MAVVAGLGASLPRALHLRAAFIAFLFVLSGCATPLPLPEAPETPFGQGRLWKVEHPGGGSAPAPSFVFGTMHVTDPRVFELPDEVEAAFDSAEVAAFEVDYRRRSDRETLNQFFYLPDGQSLRQVLDYDTFRDLRNVLPAYGYYKYSRYQPWVAWMAISNRETAIDRQVDPERPMLDDWFVLRAKKAGKEVAFLETDLEQWRAFGGIPMDDQVSMLRSAIDTYYSARTRVDRVAIYLDGNLALLQALWDRSLSHLDPTVARRYTERLLTDRNRRMVERALPVMNKKTVFIAIGAAHLPGDGGVLDLLEKQGYQVTRVY